MLHISISWRRLLKYTMVFIGFSLIVTAFLLLLLSASLSKFFEWRMQYSGFIVASSLFVYVSFPALLIRFIYYFFLLLRDGRKPGIAVVCWQTLYNPLNFLIFASLLNSPGLYYRLRCLVSLFMLVGLYSIIYLIIAVAPVEIA